MDLSIGRLISSFDEAAARAFEQRGLPYAPEWSKCAKNIATIDIFNLASIDLFLQYVSSIQNRSQLIKFRQLPAHTYDVWLPFDFEPTSEPEISDGHWPVGLLSSPRLVSELDEIRRVSDLDLGEVPHEYQLMRNNHREFYKLDVRLDDRTLLQWIWKGLRDAAQLSLQHSAPVLSLE